MRKLILFTVTDINDMLRKGNVWYLRHYETFFDKIYAVYILGASPKPITSGNTTLVPLGTGNNIKDLFLAPYRLYKFARKTGPAEYLTADPVFLWWTTILIRLLLKANVYFLPVCMPQQLYRNTKRSLFGMPFWLEKIFLKLSFMAASQVVTTKNATIYVEWLQSISCVRNKLRIVDMLVDEMPTIEFYESFDKEMPRAANRERIILYVGRLHREKMVEDILRMVSYIQKDSLTTRLQIIGEGAERNNLEALAIKLGVSDRIDFLGSKQNKELVWYYKNADVFISACTGTALREAALCKLPIVAYNIDWVKGFLVHEENALLVEKGDVQGMARQVIRVLEDKELAKKVSESLYSYALERWSRSKIGAALKETFGPFQAG